MSTSLPVPPVSGSGASGARFEMSLVRDGLHPVLELRGELDLRDGPTLEGEVERVTVPAGGTLVLDLSGLAFMDSSGLRAILTADAGLRERGARLVLVRGPAAVHRVFTLTRTDRHLTFLD